MSVYPAVWRSRFSAKLVPGRNESSPTRLLLTNDAVPEEQPRFVGVVRAAAQLDVLHGRLAASRIRLDVVEFEKCRLRAASVIADRRAPTRIPSPDGSPHCCRDVARTLGARFRRARSSRFGEALAFEPLDQERDGAVEDLGRVARRHRVAQQCLGATEPVVRLARDGELNPVALRRDRHDARGQAGGRGESSHVAVATDGDSGAPGSPGGALPADTNEATGTTGDAGSRRTTTGASGWGRSEDTSSSIWRFDLWVADASTAAWFSIVRCGASRRTAVKVIADCSNRSRISG